MASLSPREIRGVCRRGEFSGPTAGLAPGFEQANLVMLPEAVAGDFKQFCELNSQPCPLLEMTPAGVYEPQCAPGADLRTDLPRYRVYARGKLIDQPTEVVKFCPSAGEMLRCDQHDISLVSHHSPLVSILLGCSFTFESVLLRADIPVRHLEQGRNVPMYRTGIACKPAGIFSGPMVVSMRPMTPAEADQARAITAGISRAHGAPIHIGDPAAIGITNLNHPEYGDAVAIRAGEVPVFWACGVTPLEAILRAKPELAIVHEPGHMFIADLKIA